MGDQPKDRVSDLMQRLGISGRQLQNVKLGPGVVGRNSSIAWVFEVVMLAGVIASAVEHDTLMLGVSLGGSILVAVVISLSNVYFGNKNPAAALLEGAQFLEYHQMQMAAKGVPVIESPGAPSPAPSKLQADESSEPEQLEE
ncbi:MAG: hypothetical protein WA020_08390 [Candidatus Acidiferrales bacterium]